MEEISEFGAGPGARVEIDGAWAELLGLRSKLADIVGVVLPNPRPRRAVTFGKTSAGNWLVPWHQDRVVAVKDVVPSAEYSAWGRKQGVWHAEPPIGVLQNMVFVRAHLDDATAEDGALEIALGSHEAGRVSADTAAEIANAYPNEICEARRGDVLIAHALILHRSQKSLSANLRRALRVDYSADKLPGGAQWAYGGP
ncbi:MAG: phytanoyl-CoA dioxygenase family protein [Pseudomonadota bacterium]